MTDTALQNAFYGADSASSVNPALRSLNSKSVAGAQKTDGSAQDFGAVLDKTAQKYEQKSGKPVQAADSSAKSQTQQSEKESAGLQSDQAVEDTGADMKAVESEAACDTQETAGESEAVTAEEPVGEFGRIEEPVDEIANALEQIIEQIKQILGITDEELLAGMETVGLQPYDLLNTDNMAQLVAAISGEDSAISLVADEKLYTALQEITQTVDTQVENLLTDTGLTS